MKLHNFIFLAILLFFSTNIYAGIRPSFSLDYCSWEATDIVVATEGDVIDGNFIVLESLKGSVLPDETISVPEFADFAPKPSRLVKFAFGENSKELPQYVSGQKMILFLKRKIQSRNSSAKESKAKLSSVWEAASYEKEMNVSVVWLEEEKSFAFIQIVNPGDSILVDYGKSEQQIKERISEVKQTQTSLNQIIAVPEKSSRADGLAPFTSSELHLASKLAFEELQKCGDAALPVLRRMLNDDSKLNLHDKVIESLATIGGKKVSRELTDIVREEMLFWKTVAPRLKEGWWNEINESETETLRDHYSKVLQALYSLQKLKFAGSKEVVTEFRDFWRSLPQLEDKGGLNQMSEACDDVLKELPSPR